MIGGDGLLQPVEPFRTPRWFKWTIGVGAITGIVLGVLIVTEVIP